MPSPGTGVLVRLSCLCEAFEVSHTSAMYTELLQRHA